jgi:hypothetical protein
MSDTAHDHPLVRDYLRRLDLAFASLPAERAKELREQITAHLDDELQPGASNGDVTEALHRLGTPTELAAEARSNLAPVATASDAAHWLRSAIARRTWKFWTILSALMLAAGVLSWNIISIQTAPILLPGSGGFGWWYPQDDAHSATSMADGAQQWTVPIRYGQRQGLFVTIYNPSSWTQTVLGYAPSSPVSPGSVNAQLSISKQDYSHGWEGDPLTDQYGLPVSIPPGQVRFLRIIWTSNICEINAEGGIDEVKLRVRVGWVTRTENVSLLYGFFLSGEGQKTCPYLPGRS